MGRLAKSVGRLAVILCIVLGSAVASAQQLSLHLENDEVYANLPFVLTVVARGFDETPQPTLSKLTIAGCKVTPLGVEPQVSSMVQIVNGQRSEHREVSFAFRFRIEATQGGQYAVPVLTAEQGGKRAQSQAGRFSVRGVEDTRDMQLRVVLPERPLWVGETVDASLEWYLRRSVGNRSFAVPLFDQEEWLEVEAPPGEPRLQGFRAGSKPLELPYDQQKVTLDGAQYSRFKFQFRLTPTKPGTLVPPPPRVVAELQTGVGQDMFGFQVPQSQLFQAVAKPLKIEIRPLPLTGRPPSFKNAVGRAFGMEVQAGRTVVRVGDPIELRVLLRGSGRLSGLILPDLTAMGLSAEQFSAPEEPPSGEVLEDGKGKLFRVSARLRSTDVKEIPALSFSYFDPEQGAYKTVTSQPIALSVKGSAVVAAGDVVSAPPGAGAGAGVGDAAGGKAVKGAADAAPALLLVGADLALSDERITLLRAPSLRRVLPLVVGLYAAALVLLVVHAVRVRKRAAWQREAEIQQSVQRLHKALSAAEREAARDAAPRLAAALRALCKELGQPDAAGRALLDRLETEAYSPSAAQKPLPADLRKDLAALAQSLADAAKQRPVAGRAPVTSTSTSTVALLLLVPALGLPGLARAVEMDAGTDAALTQKLQRARAAYQTALGESDRDRRRSGFAEAETALRELTVALPERAQLLADWGNAALLAQEPGRAVLAYRRALQLDPTLARARRNLAFVRDRLPDWLPRPRAGGTLDSVLFVGQALPAPHRQVGLAAAVLLSVALLIPWQRRRRILRLAAVLPLLCGAALAGSLVTEHDPARDAVVAVPGAILRSADSAGAPSAFSHPLPAGAEVVVDEARGDFTRVSLADGQTGWLPASVLTAVATGGR